jgi:hypothetical protein
MTMLQDFTKETLYQFNVRIEAKSVVFKTEHVQDDTLCFLYTIVNNESDVSLFTHIAEDELTSETRHKSMSEAIAFYVMQMTTDFHFNNAEAKDDLLFLRNVARRLKLEA